ncbi:GNAT family N-acetyltransferase [Mesorhizobium sp. M1B.F.Ca.ET.045.04.1.1]|uniref:GNAT family N-acetyltransferase n=1 Tax=Mesorhizobium sp. M1B.F.Ca.ET.045.04.1.1 TaxID=2493673 RepID=UPI000F762A26|nr:GNAT family N-acetyltransferase [Mesorhizobium sp. M1B.F.Ca.ET.045.04.1.1]AZO29674.1 N-acetyltransferase [Mesorhizobium sp. M1B.F.Ca.ET.045.04.1.1]
MAGLTPPRPLAADDDRDAFDCGRESLNNWLRRHAWRNQQDGVSRTSVICDSASGLIAAYVALSAGQIERAYLPKSAQRNRPDPVPIVLLGQLAVDRRYQGRGCGRSLLLFALRTAVRYSTDIGCFGVLTHPLDDAVRDFYRSFDFEDLPFDAKRSMIVRIADLRASDFGNE